MSAVLSYNFLANHIEFICTSTISKIQIVILPQLRFGINFDLEVVRGWQFSYELLVFLDQGRTIYVKRFIKFVIFF